MAVENGGVACLLCKIGMGSFEGVTSLNRDLEINPLAVDGDSLSDQTEYLEARKKK